MTVKKIKLERGENSQKDKPETQCYRCFLWLKSYQVIFYRHLSGTLFAKV